ncbi:hypothetical protein N0V88_007967 [Collariella sp. IMI 366227]|nr:hypothetical protein N0V88_007967 [Collariella sp. IMI 366227]
MSSIAAINNLPLFRPLLSPPGPPLRCDKQSAGKIWPLGICTPPTDENMGTTYEVARLPSCEKYPLHFHSAYPMATMPQPGRRRSIHNERPSPNDQVLPSASRYPVPLSSQTHAWTAAAPPALRLARSAAEHKMTRHSMRIPERISTNGGSLVDFTADITALFWFEAAKLLETIEKAQALAPVAPIHADDTLKKRVSNVLRTTQVTQNVVILALFYIYRLKQANPTAKGQPGSAYRLVVVALMLANKFLDDNTYTNKTWADVSGLSVKDIHVMEVEFLSNMRYALLVSAEQWDQWLGKLSKFWSYLELAHRTASPSPSPLLIPSPSHRTYVSPMHSPTVPFTPGVHSATHSFTLRSPNLAPLIGGTQDWPASYVGVAPSPLAQKLDPLTYRKRSFPDDDAADHPAKRVSRIPAAQAKHVVHIPSQAPFQPPQGSLSLPNPTAIPALQSRPTHGLSANHGRPQVPSLTLNTAQASELAAPQSYGPSAYATAQSAGPSLPPLASGVRAMSMVFPTTTYAPPQPVPATCGAVTPTTTVPSIYGTPTKRLSPQHGLTAYPGSSPLVMGTPIGSTGTASGLHTPISHSPSIYLQQRNSPYRPVRHVNTLLYPPPSAFLQQYHFPSPVMPNQMHYQPLGKRNEYRTGILPEFLSTRPSPLHPAVIPAPYTSLPQVLPNPQLVKGTPQPRPGSAYAGQY